ncbi:putative serine protein kinase [Podospora appendiculata]|uniref:Serine protein kinase n=1 Tax=Podospora appendiculata TaxID=314037 RepID=A0AAE0X8N1_9PEZI|nr:putative serine protein kinase [Podospora appendiculata]
MQLSYPIILQFKLIQVVLHLLQTFKTFQLTALEQGMPNIAMDTSPPPTPPSRAPEDDERRFKTITSPCEWVEDYHPCGYHPYRVIRKLGEGSYSTVWLARDQRNNRYVALKILVAEISASTTELRILHHIAQVAPVEGARYIKELLDKFEHRGPNGTHKCLAFEPMGPSVNAMVEELPQFKPCKWEMKVRYPPQMAKAILKQSLEALAFLHGNDIAHGDFQPGNMLFARNMETRLISPPCAKVDGKEDKWAPRYLCVAQPLAPFTYCGEGFKIKFSDMGGGHVFFTDPPAKPVTPCGLRAPELVLTGALYKTLDIWSFGCLIFELVTGQPLFCISGSDDFEDDDYLLDLTAQLGALPDELFQHWKTSSTVLSGGVAEGEEPLMLEMASMEDMFDQAGPDLDEEEARKLKALIRRMLPYDPAKRLTCGNSA